MKNKVQAYEVTMSCKVLTTGDPADWSDEALITMLQNNLGYNQIKFETKLIAKGYSDDVGASEVTAASQVGTVEERLQALEQISNVVRTSAQGERLADIEIRLLDEEKESDRVNRRLEEHATELRRLKNAGPSVSDMEDNINKNVNSGLTDIRGRIENHAAFWKEAHDKLAERITELGVCTEGAYDLGVGERSRLATKIEALDKRAVGRGTYDAKISIHDTRLDNFGQRIEDLEAGGLTEIIRTTDGLIALVARVDALENRAEVRAHTPKFTSGAATCQLPECSDPVAENNDDLCPVHSENRLSVSQSEADRFQRNQDKTGVMKIIVNTTSWSAERQARADAAGLSITGEEKGDDDPILCVPISNGQQVAAFPKFGTVGISLWDGLDGNTNLPWDCEAEKILNHIYENSAVEVTRDEVREAILLLQAGVPWLANEYNLSWFD